MPSGWLLCDGSAVSRETYATLFSVIGTTYGAGDGSTTFTLPNLIDKFIEGSATAGAVKSAGLPNITGGIDIRGLQITPMLYGGIGAFRQENPTLTTFQNIAATTDLSQPVYAKELDFNASRSNSIYGNSTTVQPPALTMRYAIYSGVVNKKLWLRTI